LASHDHALHLIHFAYIINLANGARNELLPPKMSQVKRAKILKRKKKPLLASLFILEIRIHWRGAPESAFQVIPGLFEIARQNRQRSVTHQTR
jgi:hypothetical protein